MNVLIEIVCSFFCANVIQNITSDKTWSTLELSDFLKRRQAVKYKYLRPSVLEIWLCTSKYTIPEKRFFARGSETRTYRVCLVVIVVRPCCFKVTFFVFARPTVVCTFENLAPFVTKTCVCIPYCFFSAACRPVLIRPQKRPYFWCIRFWRCYSVMWRNARQTVK